MDSPHRLLGKEAEGGLNGRLAGGTAGPYVMRLIHVRNLIGVLCVASVSAVSAEEGWQRLFDGRSLDGWEGDAERWKVEDGALTGTIADGETLGTNEFLYWKGEVADFELELEYRIGGGPSANSGIQIRSQREPSGHAAGLQVDLDDGAVWLGRMYDEHGRGLIMERGTRVSISPDGRRWVDPFADPASFRSVPKRDDWNRYRVVARGPHVEIWVNGVFFGALDDHQSGAADLAGRLAIQLHSGPGPAKIQVRDIRLLDLGRTEPPAASSPADAGAADADRVPATAPDGRALNLGFESGTLDDWSATGDAWAGQPVDGDTVTPRKPTEASRHAGRYWVGTFERRGDAPTGTLTSAPFVASQPWASFLVGGGKDPAKTRVEIVVAETGTVFHTAAGRDVENMNREVVDLRPVAGQKLFIRVIDDDGGPWGHVNFDDFVLHTKPPAAYAEDDRLHTSPVLWHLRPNPAEPSTVGNEEARRAVAGMHLIDGFRADLIASEPEVVQPIAFAIDERGRLWILEGLSYPNKQPEGEGRDRIVILADSDGDGVFETRTVFAEGLNLASGLEVGFGGVWVGAAPDLLFIPDRDRDDRPDGPPEVVLDGWGFQDTHETLNSFLWGPDGWLYGNQGVFTTSRVGRPGAPDSERLELRSGVWRYHPVRRVFEIFATGGSNQWGLDYNEAGHLFMTHCRSFFGGGGTTHVIRHGHFWNQANAHYAPFISAEGPDFAPDLRNYLPASAKYDSGEGGAGKPGTTAVYGGHSHVGTLVYQGENFPAIYRDHLFTHNLHGHQINHQINVRQGSGYETMHAGADLLYAPDPRYIAVDLQTGPDGAVYAIDWVDQQHCHTPIEEKWDRSNGRVYRVAWAATYKPVRVDLHAEPSPALARLQTSRNDWMARTARRLLQERAAAGPLDAETIGILRGLAASPQRHSALRGLWSLHMTGLLDDATLVAALIHDDDIVRAWAVQLATEIPGAPRVAGAVLAAMAKDDASPTVRLALASALPVLPDEAAWEIGTTLAGHAGDADDRFLPKMIYAGIAPRVAGDFPRALALATATKQPVLADSLRWLAATTPAGRDALFAFAANAAVTPDAAERIVRIAAFALRSEGTLPAPASWPALRGRGAASADRAVRTDADQLAALFGDATVLERMRRAVADTALSRRERESAFSLLRRTGDPAALPVFAGLLDDGGFRSHVIPLLARSNDPATAAALITRFAQFNEADRAVTLTTLSSQPALARALLEAAQNGAIDKKHMTALHLRQIRTLNDDTCNQLLETHWGRFNDTPAATRETIDRIRQTYREAPLWAFERAHGREVYDRVCAICHALGGSSDGKLGPDLAGTWRNGADYFIENIVDPNAVVGDAYQLGIVTLKDGTVVAGAVENESPTSISVRTIPGPVVSVPVAEVQERQKLEQSLMPPGILEALSERDMIALLKFLTTRP